ncbi:FdhF/YdeP family oxidoreductase [Acidomonas methanolica]|uniref:Formate dehydrogenase alpha subunit/molybdopterin oxidoreductase n=1 Tax=Acidomonas methanolica NBRC 104435 TaxID=1231351 RepID=A0A023D2N5_ACIMT|nr:FdhF/YdeP family oxidoreductase [Acidomonas methanolica]MBU2654272.1 FdhF/YdeP family oxidoreductase [Acidomonas methanolica]TCS29289.1 formate dehydrogenase major subunit [Acidomonas methanolica]GAJ28025.1 formate dehydrogenase alpha subunit/molybdopterin oxidoreductase [Acidomonas methanolica NBRC 104435]GBQ45303.1 formate dehydrogenase subunit alpha [Acidomonas methanolica]GEK99311.1 formate dehydrogenase subunit alpha [Acidomonas methanolica NBRC 104435]
MSETKDTTPDTEPRAEPRYKPYAYPAGGWGAAKATAKVLLEQSVVGKGSRALLAMNKPGGFKCPSCAFPDPDREKTLEFCENGAKALAVEATKKRVTRAFFAQHTVTALMAQSDYWLEEQGRLTEPMRYEPETDRYVPISWDDAYAMIGAHLRALDHPDEAEFYTSGRTSNEAAFLYSIFVRQYGTNNFPDCSNMCHEPTSRGLPHAIGVGKGTIVMADFDHAEAIFIFGQNTGTNSPRMMTNLVDARKRGVPVVIVNPMPERALIRFAEPQDPVQMATFGSTAIASEFVHVRIGGDLAFVKGMVKAIFERAAAGEDVLDRAFLAEHTHGMEAWRDEILALDWEDITRVSGVGEEQIRRAADIYVRSNATVLCFGMGITQHQNGARMIQQLAALLMLRGNFGKPGAGIAPIRGHSNVQGDRTVGIDEKPGAAYLDRVREVFGFEPPRAWGHHVVESVEAMIAGRARVFIGLGGNFIHAIPETALAYEAMRRLNLTVGIATKLNRGHLVHGRDALILPVIARSEIDRQATGEQFVTIEDAMSNVTSSRGVLEPASPDLRSEVEIVCRIARATLPESRIPWESYIGDYGLIREKIAEIYPAIYADFPEKIKNPKGFHLDIPPRRRVWNTPTGKANFLLLPGLHVDDIVTDAAMLRLSTIRSHDQYNTTIYSNSDRYRGIYNDRMVLFLSKAEREARGLPELAKVALETISTDGITRRVEGLTIVDYPMPRGSVAGYYPELNPLLPLTHFDEISGTPAAKSIPVRIVPLTEAAEETATKTEAA